MTETARRRRTLGAGHYKFICVVHTLCCIGFFVIGCISVPYSYRKWELPSNLYFSPSPWAFLLFLKSFALALTDYIIATKGERCIRDDKGRVPCLAKFQATISVLSLPVYGWGMFISVAHMIVFGRDLVFPSILYYTSFVSSVFVTFSCCYASCSCCGNSRHDVEQSHERVVAVLITENGFDSSTITKKPLVESPPNIEPCASVERSADEDPPPKYTVM